MKKTLLYLFIFLSVQAFAALPGKLDTGRIPFSAHRGLQPFAPENSYGAFKAAAEHGCWAIETDFRMTKDGKIVCMHDKAMKRTTGMAGDVSDYTLKQLRSIKVLPVNTKGAEPLYDYSALSEKDKSIPTIQDYLRICKKGGCIAFIELKEDDGGLIEKMMRLIKRYGMTGRCVISSGNMEFLKEYRKCGGKEVIHLIFGKPENIPALMELGNAAIAFNYPDPSIAIDLEYNGQKFTSTRQLVDYCHSLGLLVCFRAVDNMKTYKTSSELGIDYYPTNNMWADKLNK